MLVNSITLKVLAVVFLVVLIILTPLLALFHNDVFYDFAYEQNDVYEVLDAEVVWLVTENFQSFLLGKEELFLFDEDQASHLDDVKHLYVTGRVFFFVILVLFTALFFFLRDMGVVVSAAKASFVVLAVFLLLALNWEWFFTSFHLLFFEGNWQFSSASLMIRLWGGSFFVLAAAFAFLQSVFLSVCLFFFGKKFSKFFEKKNK